MVKDLICFYLIGEVFFELIDILGINLINVCDCKYDDELLVWWEFDELWDKLFFIKCLIECCGKIIDDVVCLIGLCVGMLVFGGVFDILVFFIVLGINSFDKMVIVIGIWSINEYVIDYLVIDKDLFMIFIYFIEGKWFIIEVSFIFVSNLEWFINNFMESDWKIFVE